MAQNKSAQDALVVFLCRAIVTMKSHPIKPISRISEIFVRVKEPQEETLPLTFRAKRT